jgi:hypothetical protein
MQKKINIAKDFSPYPYGRHTQHSKTSGERFREDFLLPALKDYDEVIINLDGTEGYGSSFLDEAFGNLVRVSKVAKDEALRKLKFISLNDPSLIDEITMYIRQAKND